MKSDIWLFFYYLDAKVMSSVLLMSIAIAVVAICAGLAAFGYKGRVTTIGVDLGTSFSVVGIVKGENIEIVEDEFGHKIFPSIVSFQNDGKVYSLYDALEYLKIDPDNTVYNAKRFIGGNVNDAQFKEYALRHPFRVKFANSSSFSNVGFDITSTGHAYKNANSIISPEDVGTQVLLGLKKITSAFIGHDQIKKAVVAVPAKFSEIQRQATAEAYKNAGLKVVRMIDEPTAAAVAYDLHKKPNIHHIIVYDFGGGTLDVSLLYVSKGSVQVYATDGDEELGGSDFDICLERIVLGKLTSATASSSAVDDNVAEIVWDFSDGNTRRIAELVKISLSSSSKVIIVNSKSKERVEILKKEFLEGCSELFDRSLTPVIRLLSDLAMSPQDIDEVVLVGGTTRIPKVKTMLKEFFGKDEIINDRIDPDITVAYGAASIID